MTRGGPSRRRSRRGVAALLVLGVLSLPACADPARDRFERAEKDLLEQKMEAALSGYRAITRDFTQSRYAPAALLRQGDLFGSYYRNYPAALEAYESLVYNYPRAAEVPQACLRKGEIRLLQFFDNAAAAGDLELVRRQFPRFEKMDEVLFLLARAYAGMSDSGRQIAVLTELVEKFPASARALEGRWMMAYAFLGQQRFSEAGREFRKILYLVTDRGDVVRARWGMAQSLEGLGDLREALEQYEAIRTEWDDPGYIAGKISRLRERMRAS